MKAFHTHVLQCIDLGHLQEVAGCGVAVFSWLIISVPSEGWWCLVIVVTLHVRFIDPLIIHDHGGHWSH